MIGIFRKDGWVGGSEADGRSRKKGPVRKEMEKGLPVREGMMVKEKRAVGTGRKVKSYGKGWEGRGELQARMGNG